jgi:hypothetical protein
VPSIGEKLADLVAPEVAESDEVGVGERAERIVGSLRPHELDRARQRLLGFGLLAETFENTSEMVEVEEVLRLDLELAPQQRQVAAVLVRLVALVADVREEEIRDADRSPVLLRHALDRRHDLLVDHALETDARVVAPDSVLPVRRRAAVRLQEDPESDFGRVPQQLLDGRTLVGIEALVGVDVEDPLAGGQPQGLVPGFGGPGVGVGL